MSITLTALKRLLRLKVETYGSIRELGRAYDIQPIRISESLKPGVEPWPQVVEMLGYRKSQAKYEHMAKEQK